ncbi:MAG: hypothetical protein LBI36_02900, partial [Oscillospiraceae bacterium]|nr:hypothetical protein [Oscillospiraceae bacterium]
DRFSLAEYGVSLSAITENYDRVVYGGERAGSGDFYGIYVKLTQTVQKIAKKNKAAAKQFPRRSIETQF